MGAIIRVSRLWCASAWVFVDPVGRGWVDGAAFVGMRVVWCLTSPRPIGPSSLRSSRPRSARWRRIGTLPCLRQRRRRRRASGRGSPRTTSRVPRTPARAPRTRVTAGRIRRGIRATSVRVCGCCPCASSIARGCWPFCKVRRSPVARRPYTQLVPPEFATFFIAMRPPAQEVACIALRTTLRNWSDNFPKEVADLWTQHIAFDIAPPLPTSFFGPTLGSGHPAPNAADPGTSAASPRPCRMLTRTPPQRANAGRWRVCPSACLIPCSTLVMRCEYTGLLALLRSYHPSE